MRILIRGSVPKSRYECFDCHESWRAHASGVSNLDTICPFCHGDNVFEMN